MTLQHMLILALAAWRITYEVTFGMLLEGVRDRLGICYFFDQAPDGMPDDRITETEIGRLINCHSCVSLASALMVLALWFLGLRGVIYFLAISGAAGILGRWWMSQRIRKHWWL